MGGAGVGETLGPVGGVQRPRTYITCVSHTAAKQAYIGPLTLGSMVANFTTAKALNVTAGDGGVSLLTTLIASVGLPFVLHSNLQRAYVLCGWNVFSQDHSYMANAILHVGVTVVFYMSGFQYCSILS